MDDPKKSRKKNPLTTFAVAGLLSGAALFAGCSDSGAAKEEPDVESNGCAGADGCGAKDESHDGEKDAQSCSAADDDGAREESCAAEDSCGAADDNG